MNEATEKDIADLMDHVEEMIAEGDGRGGFRYSQPEAVEILRKIASEANERADIIQSEIDG